MVRADIERARVTVWREDNRRFPVPTKRSAAPGAPIERPVPPRQSTPPLGELSGFNLRCDVFVVVKNVLALMRMHVQALASLDVEAADFSCHAARVLARIDRPPIERIGLDMITVTPLHAVPFT